METMPCAEARLKEEKSLRRESGGQNPCSGGDGECGEAGGVMFRDSIDRTSLGSDRVLPGFWPVRLGWSGVTFLNSMR